TQRNRMAAESDWYCRARSLRRTEEVSRSATGQKAADASSGSSCRGRRHVRVLPHCENLHWSAVTRLRLDVILTVWITWQFFAKRLRGSVRRSRTSKC